MVKLIANTGFSWDTTMYSAIIAAIVSFLVWLCTIGYENFRKRREQKKLDSANLTYLSFLLLGALTSANQQIRKLREYIDNYDESLNFDYVPLSLFPHLDIQTLAARIDQEKYFTSFVSIYQKNESELKSIKNVFTATHYLNDQLTFLIEMSNSFYRDERANNLQLSNLFSLLLIQIGDLRYHEPSREIMQFLNVVESHQRSYLDARKSEGDFSAALQSFIIPLMSEIAVNFSSTIFLREIVNTLFQFRTLSEQMIKNRFTFKNELVTWYNSSLSSVKSLKEHGIPIIRTFTPVNEEIEADNSQQ